MASTSNTSSLAGKVWGLLLTLLLAGLATVGLTRPAETAVSFTPLSELITLKAMAAEAVPYERAIATPQPTLIEFYADWCTTCQGMSATLADLHQRYGHQINFVMLNIDDPQWAEPVSSFGATGVPQFTLLDSTHQAVKTWVGKVPEPVFTALFDQLLR